MRYLTVMLLAICTAVFAQSPGRWHLERAVDEFTDTETHMAIVIVLHDAMRHSAVAVRCENGRLSAHIDTGVFLTSSAPVRVRYRFDDGEPQTGAWSISTNGDAVFAPDPAAFARELMAGRSLLFEAVDYRGTPHTSRLPLKGSQAAIRPVLAACSQP